MVIVSMEVNTLKDTCDMYTCTVYAYNATCSIGCVQVPRAKYMYTYTCKHVTVHSICTRLTDMYMYNVNYLHPK